MGCGFESHGGHGRSWRNCGKSGVKFCGPSYWTGNQKRPRGTRVKHHRTDVKAAIPQGRRVPEVRCACLRSGGRLRASSRGGGIRHRSSAERAPPSGGGRRRFESGRGHVGTHDVPWKTEECWSIPAAVAHARRRETRAPGRRAKAGAERRAAFLSGARIKGMESRRPAPSPSLSRPPPAPVAQGIERHPPKVGVVGSNPAEGTSGVTPPPE